MTIDKIRRILTGRDEFMEKQEKTLENQHFLKIDYYIF